MRFVYPKGKRKALTFSYDDGQVYDRKLVEIFNRYGMKGTFHINSGTLSREEDNEVFITAKELAELFKGHEVACHGVEHRNLPTITRQQAALEIGEDRKALEKLTGNMIKGMSYAFGNYSGVVKEILKDQGIKYCRTVNSTGGFFPPVDFLEWHPTCHHDNRLLEFGDRFLDVAGFYELPLMYVWGHSFEFGRSGDWSVIEAFAEKMSGKEDIWYATNMEICNYIEAVRRQEFSADGNTMYNPTAITIWVSTSEGLISVEPGAYGKVL